MSQVRALPEDRPGQVDLFPAGRLDQDLQQVDCAGATRGAAAARVSSVELLEVTCERVRRSSSTPASGG